MAHCVVTTERMQAEYDGTKRYAVKFNADTDNGLIFKLGDLVEGEREVYSISDATAGTDLVGDLVLITTPEVMADPRMQGLADFYNKKDSVGAGTLLCERDIFSVTAEGIANVSDLSTKKYATVTAGGKITLDTAATNAFAQYVDTNQGKYAFRVLKRPDAVGSGE